MMSRMARLGAALVTVTSVGTATASAALDRPPPPPKFMSSLERGPVVAGRAATFTYRIESADAFTLTLTQKPSVLSVLRTGSTPYRLENGRPRWVRRLPGRVATTHVIRIRVRIGAAWAGRTVCLKLSERLTYGGVPDVFEQRSCARVAKA